MSPTNGHSGGLFGKLPGLDDFVRRGLPLTFVTPWESWLGRMMSGGWVPNAEVWTPLYLTSPPWRFALDPGLSGPTGWIGVMASSVDRFGRAFPLTLAVPFSRTDGLLDLTEGSQPLARALEGLALDLIEGSLSVEDAAREIGRLSRDMLPQPQPIWRDMRQEEAQRRWVLTGRGHHSVGAGASDLLSSTLRAKANGPAGLSFWWHEGWGGLQPASVLVQGLPGGETYMRMMDGAWGAEEALAP
ncbi:type VI secretion system-associated protein TagF [Xanthobacteraceae bacterium A53D]